MSHYVYLTEVPPSGPSLDVAAHKLSHDVEAYLFDDSARGYRNLAFLDWAVQRFLATKASSGLVSGFVHWDSDKASVEVDRKYTGPSGETDYGIRYSDAALAAEDIDTSSDVHSDADDHRAVDYGLPLSTPVVSDPNDARHFNSPAAVVTLPQHREVADPEPSGGDA